MGETENACSAATARLLASGSVLLADEGMAENVVADVRLLAGRDCTVRFVDVGFRKLLLLTLR